MRPSQERGAQIVGCSTSTEDNAHEDSLQGVNGHLHGRDSCASSRTVLFVDDDPSLLEAHRLMFEFMGYSVFTAESGEEALEVLQSTAVDAVVLDYEMPGMDGEETARQIRKMHGHLPIILSSGFYSLPQRVLEIANASVPKTMRSEVLFDMLEQQLEPISATKGAHEIAIQLDLSIPA